jgi:nucleotide-binding universal stress UspA family protein
MMYKKILVPMDGSSLAECSLEHVKTVAIGCHIPEVVLLIVVEPLSYSLATDSQMSINVLEKIDGIQKTEATNYISKMVQKLNKEGLSAKGEVILGRVDEQILNYTDNNNIDLIIMSTHGRSGVTRWAFGSVADKVVRHSKVPVLTVVPPGCRISQT